MQAQNTESSRPVDRCQADQMFDEGQIAKQIWAWRA
jgi:hypothetical protein